VRHRLDSMSMPLQEFVDRIDEHVIARAPGLGVWLTKVARGASPMLLDHVRHNSVMHDCVVLMTFLPDRRPRVPFAERQSVERLGHGFFHIKVRLGFMQTPDVPLTLGNCELLGFDADFDRIHYYVGHEVVIRRPENSAMGQISFAIFAFLTRIASRAPDFFRIPHEGLSEVGFRLEI
jgi:KUP system potassium uptake protein